MTSSIKIFNTDKNLAQGLTSDEKKAYPILVEAAKKVDKIYQLQENNLFSGANLYPPDVSREQVELAAKENSKIFSPFTVVKRDNNKLIAVDYHTEFAQYLKPIAQLLKEASNISKNASFKRYLEALSESLVKGNYQKTDIAWLAVRNSNIDVTIGPHERYLDKLFFVKRAYQAAVGLIDKDISRKAKTIRDVLYNTVNQNPHRIVPPQIVDLQVQRCTIMAGFLGRALFNRQHLPSDADITESYGSRIVGYLSAIDHKFEKLIYPVFNTLFEKNFKTSYPKELLKTGNYYFVLLTAIAQQLHRYRNSRLHLKELFPIFDEANCTVSGIQHAKHLVLKGVIDQKELEVIMISHICWIFSEWIIAQKTNLREDYLKGYALVFNFLTEVGAIQEKEGISWPNFAKMFFEIENLSTIFTRVLEDGTYLEAQEFLAKYLSFIPFKSFEGRLSKVKTF